MRPFSIYKRLTYLGVCIVIFAVTIPAIVLYASGYRLTKDFTLVKTGGIFVKAEPGSSLFINGKPERGLGTFGNSFFVQNLRPGLYEVAVEREGYERWRKSIAVHEGLVSESSAFLFPAELELEDVPEFIGENESVQSEKYGAVSALFDLMQDTDEEDAYIAIGSDIGLLRENDRVIYAKWLRSRKSVPAAFCIYSVCRTAFPVFTAENPVISADFYPGRNDVIIVATKTGVYAVEIDKTPPQHRYTVYEGEDVDFRIDGNGELYIRDGEEIKKITL